MVPDPPLSRATTVYVRASAVSATSAKRRTWLLRAHGVDARSQWMRSQASCLAPSHTGGARCVGGCRMGVLPDLSAASLHPFVTDHVEPGATVITEA